MKVDHVIMFTSIFVNGGTAASHIGYLRYAHKYFSWQTNQWDIPEVALALAGHQENQPPRVWRPGDSQLPALRKLDPDAGVLFPTHGLDTTGHVCGHWLGVPAPPTELRTAHDERRRH